MDRKTFIERTLRQIYNGQPNDDATITPNLVNTWLSDAIAIAAKANYKDNLAIDSIGYVNNGFYTSFKNIPVTPDETLIWKVRIPEIPVGIGTNEGISVLQFKDSNSNVSIPCVPLSENQRTFFESMRPIPNKVLYYYEGEFIYAKSTLILSQYTASITMISGGVSSDLNSTLNVPPDYFPTLVEYIKQQLTFERMQPKDVYNDGEDFVTTT